MYIYNRMHVNVIRYKGMIKLIVRVVIVYLFKKKKNIPTANCIHTVIIIHHDM